MTTPPTPRHIFFCHGFDRRGARFYNLWQRREVRRYNVRFGANISIGDVSGTSWRIKSNRQCNTFEVLDWSSIVRARFRTPAWRSLVDLVRIGTAAMAQGFFGKTLRRDWSLGLLLLWGFVPFFGLLLGVIIAVFTSLWLIPAMTFFMVGFLALMARMDGRFGMVYVGHIAWAARRMALRDDAEMEAFVAASVARVRAVPEGQPITIVGHSIGAALAVRIAAEAGRDVSLLTVGASTLLVSAQKEAGRLRYDIEKLRDINWIDVSARKDMLGSLAVDVSDGHAQCITVNLTRAFGEDHVKSLRWNGFGMHFLYFHANLCDAPWDWMGLIAGDRSIEAVFEGARRRSGRGERRFLF